MKKLASLTMLMSVSAFGNGEFPHGDCRVKIDEVNGDKFTPAQIETIKKKGFVIASHADMTMWQEMESRKRGTLYLSGENKLPQALAGTRFNPKYSSNTTYLKNFNLIPRCHLLSEDDFSGKCSDLSGSYRVTHTESRNEDVTFGIYPFFRSLKVGTTLKIDQKNCLDYEISLDDRPFKRISIPFLQNGDGYFDYDAGGVTKLQYSESEVTFHHSTPKQGWVGIGVDSPVMWSYFRASYHHIKLSKSGSSLQIISDERDVNGKKFLEKGLAEKID